MTSIAARRLAVTEHEGQLVEFPRRMT